MAEYCDILFSLLLKLFKIYLAAQSLLQPIQGILRMLATRFNSAQWY
jgi:hypothetical protein